MLKNEPFYSALPYIPVMHGYKYIIFVIKLWFTSPDCVVQEFSILLLVAKCKFCLSWPE